MGFKFELSAQAYDQQKYISQNNDLYEGRQRLIDNIDESQVVDYL